MSLTLGDNFSYQASKPLDARLKYDTVAAMKAVGDSTMYDGCLAYCVATDKTYQWKSTNTVDTDLGKWREFSSGGGGGHAIEDSEGTALTQRETMQFGEGFLAEDDAENEKTVISPNVMQSGDMSDVVTTLPYMDNDLNKMPVLFDESGAERVVGWYKYANGTKKPVYSKTKRQDYTASTFPTSVQLDMELPSDYALVDVNVRYVYADGKGSNKNQYNNASYFSSFYFNVGKFNVTWNINNISSFTVVGEVLYTKTTDTPNT